MAETRTISARKGTESEAAPASKPQRPRITKRKALENHARSYFDAVARRDVEGMIEHWKEDGVVDLVPLGILRGRDGDLGILPRRCSPPSPTPRPPSRAWRPARTRSRSSGA